MTDAYVDTSCVTAVVLRNAGWQEVARLLDRIEQKHASNLLEAELRATLHREKVDADPAVILQPFRWIHPDRALSQEYHRVLETGYIRGADLWHLACALFIAPSPADFLFLTLDQRQAAIARELGFQTA